MKVGVGVDRCGKGGCAVGVDTVSGCDVMWVGGVMGGCAVDGCAVGLRTGCHASSMRARLNSVDTGRLWVANKSFNTSS